MLAPEPQASEVGRRRDLSIHERRSLRACDHLSVDLFGGPLVCMCCAGRQTSALRC